MARKNTHPIEVKDLFTLEYGSETVGIPPRPIVHLSLTEFKVSGRVQQMLEESKRLVKGAWK